MERVIFRSVDPIGLEPLGNIGMAADRHEPFARTAASLFHTIAYLGTEIEAGRLRIAEVSLAHGPVFEAVVTPAQRRLAAIETGAVAVLLMAIVALPFAVLGVLVVLALRAI